MPSFLVRIYAFKLFDSLILILPLYAVMMVDAGLSPVQVSVAMAAWSIATFALQVPAGVLADRWPRRWILAGAQAVRGGCYLLWFLFPDFWGFLIGLVLWGVKSAFTNGIFEALLYDELKAAGRAAEYTKIFGRTRAVQAGAILAASAGAAVVAGLGYPAAIFGSLVATALAIAAALSLPPTAPAVRAERPDYLGQLRRGFAFAATHRPVLSILIFAALVNALGPALQEYWPIYGAKVGLGRQVIPILIGVQYGVEALSALAAHRLTGLSTRALYRLFAIAGVLLAAAAAIFQAPAMLLLALYSGAMRALDVIFEGRLQVHLPSEMRATLGSVKGFTAQAGVFTLYLGFGPLAQATSYQGAFLACGAAVALIGAAYLLLSPKRETSLPA